jgi:ornithine carbamoyltransferase
VKHLLSLSDLGREGLLQVLDAADHFKATRGADAPQPLRGKSVALIFEKASTRTRIALEVAVSELGGTPLVINSSGSQLGRGEPVEDTARVLSRMVHAITLRTFAESTLLRLAQYSSVPVLNALTDSGHPMQLLADLQIARREFSDLSKLKFSWVGDGNNMANSWIEAAGLLGLTLVLACPAAFIPDPERVSRANALGGKVSVVPDPKAACRGAHVINTDVFASMGQESEAELRLRAFRGFCVDETLVQCADPSAIVLHCLPAHRGEEISAQVLDGPHSRVWDQAEARLHTSKAALCWALQNGEPPV